MLGTGKSTLKGGVVVVLGWAGMLDPSRPTAAGNWMGADELSCGGGAAAAGREVDRLAEVLKEKKDFRGRSWGILLLLLSFKVARCFLDGLIKDMAC